MFGGFYKFEVYLVIDRNHLIKLLKILQISSREFYVGPVRLNQEHTVMELGKGVTLMR